MTDTGATLVLGVGVCAASGTATLSRTPRSVQSLLFIEAVS
jgi:hypothetical protein